MHRLVRPLFFLSIIALLPGLGFAQQVTTYAPPADTVFLESYNPHVMYWVVGSDTLGTPVHSLTLEVQSWSRVGEQIQIRVHQERLLPERSTSTDTFVTEPNGRVLQVNGRAPGSGARIDLLPRLPASALAVGTQWTDTLAAAPSSGAGGEHVYSISRHFHVARGVDTLGTRLLEIHAEGRVRYRDGWWADSTQSAAAWVDVTGPVREVIGLDPRAGQILYRSWQMDLRGEGGLPDGRKGPAGLLSGSRERRITRAEAAILREQPERALQTQR